MHHRIDEPDEETDRGCDPQQRGEFQQLIERDDAQKARHATRQDRADSIGDQAMSNGRSKVLQTNYDRGNIHKYISVVLRVSRQFPNCRGETTMS